MIKSPYLFPLLAIFTFVVFGSAANLFAEANRPNIVLIMLDDMGYGDAGCYNPESKIPTPNIDRLADEGMRCTDAHAAGALCVPSRYGMLTGRYPIRDRSWTIKSGTTTIASLLKQYDYDTAMVGKWHNGFDETNDWRGKLVGGPVGCGFDTFFGIPHSLDIQPYLFIQNDHVVQPPTETITGGKQSTAGQYPNQGWSEVQGAFWREGKAAPDFRHDEVLGKFTDKAVSFLQKHRESDPDKPFFLYLAYAGPHTPWLPSKEFLGKSGAGMYGDYLMEIDAAVGRVIDTLKATGVKENTLIILTSDNGPVWFPKDVARFGHSSVGPLRGMKADAFEGGHRVPFIAAWPGKIPAGTVNNEVICLTDLMRTFAAILGEDLPEGTGIDSVNLLPALLNQQNGPVRTVTLHKAKFLAVRKGKYKFLVGRGSGGFLNKIPISPDDPPGQLYDLENDLGEINNLYLQYPELVKEFEELLGTYKRPPAKQSR